MKEIDDNDNLEEEVFEEENEEEDFDIQNEKISEVVNDIKKIADKAKEVSIDENIISENEDEISKYYAEWSNYLKVATGIVPCYNRRVIPTGIDVLDTYLGGGFVLGAIPMIVGNPGTAKSTLAAQFLARVQKDFTKKSYCMYLDSEEAMTTERLADLGVVNPKMEPYGDVTIEKVFTTLEAFCVFKETHNKVDVPTIIVWDSIANTYSEKEKDIMDPNKALGYRARLLSFLIPRYVSKCSKYNICLLSINQFSDKIDIGNIPTASDIRGLPRNKRIPGGNKLKFNCAQLLELKLVSFLNSDKYGFDGIEIVAKFDKNKLFTPYIPFKLIGSYISGFSNYWTNYELLVENGRIKAPKGGWNYMITDPSTKFRAKETYNMYRDKEEFRNDFDKQVKEVLTEIKENRKLNVPKF